MHTFFIGFTLLVAHTVFFTGHDLLWLVRAAAFNSTGLLLRLAAAAFMVGIFFKLSNLPSRLARPTRGKVLVRLGTGLYFISAFIFLVAEIARGPGSYLIAELGLYIAPIAMILILLGGAQALLEAAPSPSPNNAVKRDAP